MEVAAVDDHPPLGPAAVGQLERFDAHPPRHAVAEKAANVLGGYRREVGHV
jgi:hypothetical protein